MQADDIRKVAVVGAGLMGHGIALEFALAGFRVSLNDVDDASLDRAMQRIDESLGLLRECDLTDQGSSTAAVQRIETHADLAPAVQEADVVIEAMSEDLELKRQMFQQLDQLCPSRTILASNSSSFVPSLMADATKRPDQFIGTHYFNPPHLIPLVEVILGNETSDSVADVMVSLFRKIKKTPVLVRKERPGFIANRIQAAVWREILSLVAEGVATPEDIDLVVSSSIGRRWSVAGPFEITDLIGLDLKQAIVNEIIPSLDSSTEVHSILDEQVQAGNLGIKTGRGFREWTPERVQETRERIARALATISGWSNE